MFSQRNNPYYELLKSEAKVMIISRINNFFKLFLILRSRNFSSNSQRLSSFHSKFL